MKIYLAGKVSPNSHFGTAHWREPFARELSQLSGLVIENLDPLAYENDREYDPGFVFNKDCWLVNRADCVIVYLSDDISVGGSQEMLIAKYLGKPLIGLAPREGKFNKFSKEISGRIAKDYVDPFVFATCDIIVEDIDGIAKALVNLPSDPKTIDIISQGIDRMDSEFGTK